MKLTSPMTAKKMNRMNGIYSQEHAIQHERGAYPKMDIRIDSEDYRGRVHPTQKPVKLLEYLVKTYTNEGDTILDFTMGSGTTGVACVNTNRKFIGIELDKKYYEISAKRIAETPKPLFLETTV